MLKNVTAYCALLMATLCATVFAQRPMPGRSARYTSPYILRFAQRAGDTLHLELLTRKRYNHGGYRIDLAKTVADKEITVKIGGVSVTDGLHTQAFAPARGSFAIPTEKGTYSIRIAHNDKKTTLKLVVSQSSVQLSADGDDPLFGAVTLNANILPENVFSVMIVKRTTPAGKDLTADILSAFSALPGVEKWEPKRGPYLCKHWKYPNRFLTYFKMNETLDWTALQTFVDQYKSQAHMAITIHDPNDGRQYKNN